MKRKTVTDQRTRTRQKESPRSSWAWIFFTSLSLGCVYIIFWGGVSFLLGEQPIYAYSLSLLLGIGGLYFYHGEQHTLGHALFYMMLILWIAVSVDIIDMTLEAYANGERQMNLGRFLFDEYVAYGKLLCTHPKAYLHVLVECYGTFWAYSWYPALALPTFFGIYYDLNAVGNRLRRWVGLEAQEEDEEDEEEEEEEYEDTGESQALQQVKRNLQRFAKKETDKRLKEMRQQFDALSTNASKKKD